MIYVFTVTFDKFEASLQN